VVEQQQQELAPVSLARPQALHWATEPQRNSESKQSSEPRPEGALQELHCYPDLHFAPAHPERAQA